MPPFIIAMLAFLASALAGAGFNQAMCQIIPYFLLWQASFWACRAAAAAFSPTYAKLDADMKAYWAASMVSNLHAFYIVYLCCVASWKLDIFHSEEFRSTVPESDDACAVFLGYIASDAVLALWFLDRWPGYVANLIHHGTALLCWYELLVGQYGHIFALGGMLMEGTTPFMNQRFFMDKAGQKGGLFLANGVAITVLWFVLRICCFGYIGVRVIHFRHEVMALSYYRQVLVLFSFVVGYGLQIFWFSKIVKGILKLIHAKKP